MNVLNVSTLERELRRCASYARHPAAREWVQRVARNHILSQISDKDRESNFVEWTGKSSPFYLEMPVRERLPQWAISALAEGDTLHWFDPTGVRRRNLWQALEQIVHWFNGWSTDDKRWNRLTRIDFETAASAAAMWFCDVQTNLWDYVKDSPPVAYRFKDGSGYHWVKMVTPLHFERESRLMSHCVGNGVYFNLYKQGINEYYSLRDTRNEPHATMEVAIAERSTYQTSRDLPNMSQCKGKGNGKPDFKYQPYIWSFLQAKGWPVCGDSGHVDTQPFVISGE